MNKVVIVLLLVSSVYVTEVYSNWGLPFDVPGLSEAVRTAFGSGIKPLLDVNASVAVNMARDTTGGLILVQKIIGNISVPLNNLLTTLEQDYNVKKVPYKAIADTLNVLLFRTLLSLGHFDRYNVLTHIPNARTYAAKLSTKISPQVYEAINQSITDLHDSIIQDIDHHDNLVWAIFQMNYVVTAAYNSNTPVTSTNITQFVTPYVVNSQAPRIANVVSAIDNLSKALEGAVMDINFSLVSPVIRSNLPNTAPLIGNFNATADRIFTATTQTAEASVATVVSGFKPVTDSASNWNGGNIDKLNGFLDSFNKIMQNDLPPLLDTEIASFKTNATELLSNRIFNLALVFTDVLASITAAVSTKPSFSSIYVDSCVSRYNASLVAGIASFQRVGECAQLETGSLGIVESHAREAINKVKDDVIKSMSQLRMCRDQNGPCVKIIFASFPNQFQRALTAVQTVYQNVKNGLPAVNGRMTVCMNAVSAEIESQAKTIQDNFNGCLISGH